MLTVYGLFKFLHIVGAIMWIGGFISMTVLNARLARETERAAFALIERQNRLYGMLVLGPGAGLTLLAGVVMVAVSGMGAPFWVLWGFGAIIASIAFGATLVRRGNNDVQRIAAAANVDAPRLLAAQRRLLVCSAVNALILLSAVWAMVFKPDL